MSSADNYETRRPCSDHHHHQLQLPDPYSAYFCKFRLYQTCSYFYMVGRDKSKTIWRVLKIDRSEPCGLSIHEDSGAYTQYECLDLLKRINEGNKSTGGLKFVTACYGIVGFVKFLGPYYMLLITKRRRVGVICGHDIYAICKSKIIPVPNSSAQPNKAYNKNENRYKKLLSTVDLTKDFFFSYSYHVMHSVQQNICSNETGLLHYDSMFVWNEFLTREFRSNIKSTTLWTVALVYGFFNQVKLSVSGRDFCLTLIARRSRYYAGTRFLKRGVNEKGRVANDVETEQIVIEDVPKGCSLRISSVVQYRGSIPLFWSQESSRLNIRPNIILSKKDPNYDATRLHFRNLFGRYGIPIIILNLIKTEEKKPRESVLGAEFAKAIKAINDNLPEPSHLRFLHWDLSRYSKSQSITALELLVKVAGNVLKLTGIFCCQIALDSRLDGESDSSLAGKNNGSHSLSMELCNEEKDAEVNGDGNRGDVSTSCRVKVPMFQKGVLRTNCIDCLDRTNVAQYAFGLAALGHQLHDLGFLQSSSINLDDPLADDLMKIYESMGDTLALQYGGSAAHNKIFCMRRGQWYAAIQYLELVRTLQRYYSNAYMDAEKQYAINVFLGYFQPQEGKPALWELSSDQHVNTGTNFDDENRPVFRKSHTVGNTLVSDYHVGSPSQPLGETEPEGSKGLPETAPEISSSASDLFYSRKNTLERCLNYGGDDENYCTTCIWSNFVNMDELSSSGNSLEEDASRRSTVSPPSAVNDCGSSNQGNEQATNEFSKISSDLKVPNSLLHWVNHGGALFC